MEVDLTSEEYISYLFRHYNDDARDLAINYFIHSSEESLEPLIKSVLIKHSDPKSAPKDISSFNLESRLQDFGVDSLGMMEIIVFFEHSFETVIDIDRLQSVQTVQGIMNLVKEIQSNK
jgi:acyl carrier protein